ncbi:BTAD domain-containing putative transcriptional regulator [Catellatospora sp. NPDC049609]|uniref:AfsR/SARP family transcriptional regulator n=1 Tax=Catellatospora sp. NPDC049609 TaxID=3155505 RepID=UPI0034259B02
MEFGLLGEFTIDGTPAATVADRPQRRALLVYLLLHANHSVGYPELIEALWGQRPPRTARAQLHTMTSALRRLPVIGAALSTRDHGYQLDLPADHVDVARFRRLVVQARSAAAEGDTQAAAQQLRAALGLWRGPALAGVNAPFAEHIRVRLADERVAAYEQLAVVELALGRHRQLVGPLTELARTCPEREEIARCLMEALYRCGRSREALAVGARLRRLLSREYGLAPTPELQALEQRIRTSTPVGAEPAPSRTPAQIPPAVHGFVGRDDELRALEKLRDDADSGAIAVVAGPAGVGKTALAIQWAQATREHFPDGQVYVRLRGHADTAATEPAAALRRMLSALGRPAAAPAPGADPAEQLEALSATLRSAAAQRRVLFVLDDAASAAQVLPLLPGVPGCVTVITSRVRLRAVLVYTGAVPIDVEPLPEPDALRLLGRAAGTQRVGQEPQAATELARLCAGLPLALRIAGARLIGRPRGAVAELARELADADRRLSGLTLSGEQVGLGRAFEQSYRCLTGEQADVFRGLGPIAERAGEAGATTEHIAVQLGRPPERVRSALRSLAARHLVIECRPDRYTMHELLRLYARQQPAPAPHGRAVEPQPVLSAARPGRPTG